MEIIIVIVLLIILIYYVTKAENFSPYVSTLVHDTRRSDPSFDESYPGQFDRVKGRSSENILFNQMDGWILK